MLLESRSRIGFIFVNHYVQVSDTHGVIFVNGQFLKLSFIEKPVGEILIEQKTDDLSIATQYTQRAHSKQFIFVDVKIHGLLL